MLPCRQYRSMSPDGRKKLQFYTRTAWAGQGAKTKMRQTFSPDDVKPEVKVSWLKNSTVLSIYNFDEWRWHPWWWKQSSKLITRRPRLQSDQDDDDDQPICFWWWLLVKYRSVWQKHHKTGFKLMVTLQSGCVIEILTLCRMKKILFLKIPCESSRAELSNDV